MSYKIELLDSGGGMVGFFEVVHDITLSSLAIKLEEAIRLEGVHSAIHWQVRRPDGRILFQAKTLPFEVAV